MPIIETLRPEGTFCDSVQVPSSVDDMQLIYIREYTRAPALKSPTWDVLTLGQNQ